MFPIREKRFDYVEVRWLGRKAKDFLKKTGKGAGRGTKREWRIANGVVAGAKNFVNQFRKKKPKKEAEKLSLIHI